MTNHPAPPPADQTPTWAVSLDIDMPGGIDDDHLDTLLPTLTPYSGALTYSPPGNPHPQAQIILDITAPDPLQAATCGERLARSLLAAADLPADGPLTALEVLTTTTQQQRNTTPAPVLLGVSEVAALLGVTRQRIEQIRTRPDFPTPTAQLRAGPIWTQHSLLHFRDHWDRTPGRRPTTPTPN